MVYVLEKWFQDLKFELNHLIKDQDLIKYSSKLEEADPNEKIIFKITDIDTQKLLILSEHYSNLANAATAINISNVGEYRENSIKIETLFYKSKIFEHMFWDIVRESSGAKNILLGIRKDFVIVERDVDLSDLLGIFDGFSISKFLSSLY